MMDKIIPKLEGFCQLPIPFHFQDVLLNFLLFLGKSPMLFNKKSLILSM
jgi:hypothetical protein